MVAFSPCPRDSKPDTSAMAGRLRVCFAVDVDVLQPGEFVLVCGSCEELGFWDPQSAMALTQDANRSTRWRGELTTTASTLKFRYYIGFRLSGENGDRLIIARWESFRQPRSILISAEQRNGVCREAHVDLFGYYAGQRLVSEGWLQYDEENQILLRIHGNALKFYKSAAKERKDCKIRITPLDVRNRQATMTISQNSGMSNENEDDDDEDDTAISLKYPTHSPIKVAVLSNPNPRFFPENKNGTTFNNKKDYLVYKVHSVAVEFLAFYVEVLSEDGKNLGNCYALPSSLASTFGVTHFPFINSTGRPIGQISVEYLFISRLRRPTPFQSMQTSYSRHWKKRNTLEVGHRGAGNSYTKFAAARENTIHSLNTAAKNGADYVELDVQLTKDKIAVIYHDFHVLVSVAKRGGSTSGPVNTDSIDFHEIAVKDLKLSQVKLLRLDHVSLKQNGANRPVESDDDDLKPFPTLVEALAKVDPDVGFNIEVKYPMMQTNGEHECENYFERNEFLDVIMADILNHAGDRRILISSFDPDICQMISMKQNRYPVLFLCIGESVRYTPFTDQRSSTSLTAVNFAASADILGVNFNSEDLLKDPYPVQRATEFGLVTFVWGDDLDKKDTINYFKKTLGVDGLIYDRIGEEERRRNVFMVEREQKRALFLVNSGSSTPRAPSPVEVRPTTPASANVTIPEGEELSLSMPTMHTQPCIKLSQS